MGAIFSDQNKYATWRRLWVALAKAEKAIGLPITSKQIEALERHIEEIDFEKVAQYEKELKHDVMAHLYAFGDCAPEAKGILHLGATSAYVTDNTDLIQMRAGLNLLKAKLVHLIAIMKKKGGRICLDPDTGLYPLATGATDDSRQTDLHVEPRFCLRLPRSHRAGREPPFSRRQRGYRNTSLVHAPAGKRQREG